MPMLRDVAPSSRRATSNGAGIRSCWIDYWPEILDLPRGAAPRDVINAHADQIYYVNVDTDSVLRDIDTPADYQEARKRAGLA